MSSLYLAFFVCCRPSPNTVHVAVTADRLRAIKQTRLDQMEAADWGSLLQEISEGNGGDA
ncbi:hypothetical protein SLEP1_g39995 [Rubroshorea leprosula]|uniref:Uncharacterized protein n=1 Tax=Rubroshorea leprosula TaxID=152421 RepID=A0AAV5L228_9ROSI|nr:hypothetical protein SLEP1_g39995 [Rubroshorea leprosula]